MVVSESKISLWVTAMELPGLLYRKRHLRDMQSYQLCGMMVQEYRGTRFLSTSRNNSWIEKHNDMGTYAQMNNWKLMMITFLTSRCSHYGCDESGQIQQLHIYLLSVHLERLYGIFYRRCCGQQ